MYHPAEPGCRRGPFGQDAQTAQCGGVLSFGDFSLHEQRKVTRSAAGRVKAAAPQDQIQAKRWNPVTIDITSEEIPRSYRGIDVTRSLISDRTADAEQRNKSNQKRERTS